MTITANDRQTSAFTATGGETLLPYDFRILNSADLAVLRKRAGAVSQLVLVTDYAVTGVGETAGGNVVLAAAALAGDEFIIAGARTIRRTIDLNSQTAFEPAALNGEYDALTIMLRELATGQARSLQADYFTGHFQAGGKRLEGLAAGEAAGDAVNKTQLEAHDASIAAQLAANLSAVALLSGAAAASATLAQQWAANPANVVVASGLYSALHYAGQAAASAVLAAAWAAAPVNSVVADGKFSAFHYASAASDSASAAALSASNAAADRAIAATAANNALAASLMFGGFSIYNTYADANAAVGGMPANQPVMIFADETHGGARAYYRKEGGVLVFKGLADDRIVSSISLYAPATPTATPLSVTGFTNGVPLNLAIGEQAAPVGLTGMRKLWYFGYNYAGSGARVNASEPAVGITFAINQFNYSGLPYGNLGISTISDTGVSNPVLSLEWPHHTSGPTDVRIQGYLRANKFAFYNWDSSKLVFQMDPTIDRILMGSMTFRQPNNVRFLEAINAAGSGSIEVLTLDTSDRIRTAGAWFLNLPSTLTQPAINIAPAGTALPDEWSALAITASSTGVANGNLYAVNAVLSCQGAARFNVQNNANFTNAGLQATWQALYGNSGCDIWHTFSNIGVGGTVNNWSFGIDQSEGRFSFTSGTALGGTAGTTADVMWLTKEGYFYLRNCSTVPSINPSAGPGGAIIYVSGGELYWRDTVGTVRKVASV